MKFSKKKVLISLIVLGVIVIGIVVAWIVLFYTDFGNGKMQLGVDFSIRQARYLQLDWQETYRALLDDLQVKNVRVNVPWDMIEETRGQYYFADVDWQVQEAQKRGVNLIVAIGRRTPRWPECHDPLWLKNLPQTIVVDEQLKMIETVINRYKSYNNISMWQVENEPLLDSFGVCPKGDVGLLQREVSFVKTLDSRPVLVTDSGELSFWWQAAKIGDYFGTTMYRVIKSRYLGYIYYRWPPYFYRFKAILTGKDLSKVIVSELQAEPWADGGITNSSLKEQFMSMDAMRLSNHVNFARRTGFSAAYLWGAEWWYWLKVKFNDPSLWDEAKKLFAGK